MPTGTIEMNDQYQQYLQSSEWKEKSRRIKRERKYQCEICENHILLEVVSILKNHDHPSWGIPEIARFSESILERNGDENRLLDIHHKSYLHLGSEQESELACLCRPCHVFVTENADKYGLYRSWEITIAQVREILKRIDNKPDGKTEFTPLGVEGSTSNRPNQGPNLNVERDEHIDIFKNFKYGPKILKVRQKF